MSANDSEILIAIRTALEAGGIDAANKKIRELTESTIGKSAADAMSSAEMQKLQRASQILNAALSGNAGALGRIAAVGGDATSMLAKSIPVVGAFWTGWQAGLKIGDFMWSKIYKLDDFDKTSGSIRSGLRKTLEGIEELNKAKLAEVIKEFAALDKKINEAVKDLELVQSREQKMLTARQDQEAAGLEAKYAGQDRGPAYEREKAALEKSHAEERAHQQTVQDNQKLETLAKDRDGYAKRATDAQAEAVAAREWAEFTREVASKPGVGRSAIDMAKKAEETALAKEASATKLQEEVATRNKEYERTKYAMTTDTIVQGIGRGTTERQYSGAMASASALEAEERKRAELAALEERKRSASERFGSQRDTLQSQLEERKRTMPEGLLARTSGAEGDIIELLRELDEAAAAKKAYMANIEREMNDLKNSAKYAPIYGG